MKATVPRKALASALKHVTPAVAKGGSLPVLSGVRIEATSAGLDLCCSNLDLTATSLVVDATDVEDGIAIPPAGQLQRIVDKLGGEHVHLELEENTLTITSGETVATVRTWLPDEWPKVTYPDGDSVLWSELDVDAIARIVPMAAVDGNRPVICGVYFAEGSAFTTDSYRMGMVHDLPDLGRPALIPATALRVILAAGEAVEVTVGEREVTMVVGERTVTTRLIEGEYPDVKRLVPGRQPSSLTFAREELAVAVDRASLAAVVDTRSKSSRAIHVERDGDKARVSATDPDTGATVSDVIGCRGDFEQSIGWNPDFLGDILDAAVDDDITVELTDNLKPSVVKTGRLTLLLMPVRKA